MKDIDKIKVYVYCDPRYSNNNKGHEYRFKGGILRLKYKPFYVGCAKGNGFLRHLMGKRSSKLVYRRIKKIREKKLEPIIKILKVYESKKKARKLEEILIMGVGRKDLKTGPLLNRSDGPGCKNSPRAEKASRKRMKKMWKNSEFRKNVSIGVSKATKKRWKTDFRGKKELRERNRERNLKNWQDSKYREKMSNINKGEGNPSVKLTEKEVLEIRKLKKEKWSFLDLAKKYKVGRTCVCRIVHRVTWTHI